MPRLSRERIRCCVCCAAVPSIRDLGAARKGDAATKQGTDHPRRPKRTASRSLGAAMMRSPPAGRSCQAGWGAPHCSSSQPVLGWRPAPRPRRPPDPRDIARPGMPGATALRRATGQPPPSTATTTADGRGRIDSRQPRPEVMSGEVAEGLSLPGEVDPISWTPRSRAALAAPETESIFGGHEETRLDRPRMPPRVARPKPSIPRSA
jgi:hypothetical protein